MCVVPALPVMGPLSPECVDLLLLLCSCSDPFFQLMDSWSALSFSPSVYSILRYIWMAIVIADGAFLLSFVPYFTTWIIAHPWRNPYKTIFFICSLVFVGVSIADLVFDSVILSRLSFLICLFVIAFCLVVMLRNRHAAVREGDTVTLYIADTAPLYEWQGIHRLHAYLAMVPGKRDGV